MPSARTVFLSLGSNLGDRERHLHRALELIEQHAGKLQRVSAFYRTAAWGKEEQPDFLNAAAELKTSLEPSELLRTLLSVEEKMGRRRAEKWGPRTIDIDILLYEDRIVDQAGLHVPHPALHLRRFVLEPLNEIAPGAQHPQFKKSIAQLLADCPDHLPVERRPAWNR